MGIVVDRQQVNRLVAQRGPVVTMKDADDAGVSRAVLRRLLDRGELDRLAKSAFTLTDTITAASDWERFRLRAIAFARCAAPGTYLTGAAGAVVLGIPVLGAPPDLPTALRHGDPHIGHNLSVHGRVRHGYLPPWHRTSRGGVPVVSPAYCAVDLARHLGARDGLAAADQVLHFGAHRDVLAALTDDLRSYPGIEAARWVVERADGRAESPLETLGRMAFLGAGRTPPLSNVWISAGGQWFRVDHLLADTGVILEADGAVKYDNRPDAAQLIAHDRNRERLLRSLGYGIVRYTWGLAERHPGLLLARADEAARLRPTRAVPTGWTLEAPST